MSFVSYAQNFEDVMLWRALHDVKAGFYIDVGANDPLEDSVSKAFYDAGWHGINIEPLPSHYAALAEARPRDINLNCAAGTRTDTLRIWECEVRGWATMDPAVAAAHEADGRYGSWSEVEVLPLAQICERYAPQDIHFLKIDVEGFEQQVLEGMDFRRYRPWIVLSEATRPNSQQESHLQWEPLLLETDYVFAYADGLNRFYVAKERAYLLERLKYPPNVFDRFSTNKEEILHRWALDNERRAIEAEEAAKHQREYARLAARRLEEQQARADLLAAQVASLSANIQALEQSRSWRVTRPLRMLSLQRARLKEQGLKQRIRAACVIAGRKSVAMVRARPRLRAVLARSLHATGLYRRAFQIYARLLHAAPTANTVSSPHYEAHLTPRGRRVYEDLKEAIRKEHQ